MGNSGVEPGQGGKATQEKWWELREFLKSKNQAYLTGAYIAWGGATSISVAYDYLNQGQLSATSIAIGSQLAGLTILEMGAFAVVTKEEVKEGAKKGWEKIKGLFARGDNQQTKPK